MKVKVISILEDNYMYLVIEEQSKQAVAVDPAVPHRVRSPLCFWKICILEPGIKQISLVVSFQMTTFCISEIFSDNWLHIFFVLQLLEIVKREGLSLTAVLTTHHHWWDFFKTSTVNFCQTNHRLAPQGPRSGEWGSAKGGPGAEGVRGRWSNRRSDR